MAWFAEKGFRLLVVKELTEAQPDYSADLLSGDGERRLQTRYGCGASPTVKLHSARDGVTRSSSDVAAIRLQPA
jgi:hypothetical protein